MEIQELHENAEVAKHAPTMTPVSFTMAVLAVIVATVSLLGHRAHTEEILLQNEISDDWAHYQAKTIRRHQDEMFLDITLLVSAASSNVANAKLQQKYVKEVERYKGDQADIDKEARKLERAKKAQQRQADYYDLAEALLEIALVITSITLLSSLRAFWYAGLVVGVAGMAIVILGVLATATG